MSHPWPELASIAFGGDYNPEQWPRETWDEDITLMKQAGVNLVTVGVFNWALIEPEEGSFDFSQLDQILELLHSAGIAIDLATPTAAPPAWFFANHPDARVVTSTGVALGPGSRGMASHAHPAYRQAATRIAGALAERYGSHPGVVMWHVHNEYGVPVGEDYSPAAAAGFRTWLQERYGTLEALNDAWGTAFWGQHYRHWDHIHVPAAAPSVINPAQRLDFARYTDHSLLQCFLLEKAAIRRFASQPITTNFMANQAPNVDLWKWGKEVDIVSDDHYLWAADTHPEIGLAMAADLSRSVGGGKPWILMEHSTSAVNWQERNIAKTPQQMARNSLTHLARGADAILFFQWRASRRGAEKFHSAMLPHAGTSSRIWKEVVELGGTLPRLNEIRGTRVEAQVAVLWDYESLWAQGMEWRPSVDARAEERIRAFYEYLWNAHVTVDFAHPGQDLGRYRLVVAPAQYLLRQQDAANLNHYVNSGGTLLVSFFAAAVDENDAVPAEGFLSPLRPALGLRVEEYLPLRQHETCVVTWDKTHVSADLWTEALIVDDDVEIRAEITSGPAAGEAAVTRRAVGSGHGWYVATRLDPAGMDLLMSAVLADAGVTPPDIPTGVEIVTRAGTDPAGRDVRFTTVVNHTDSPVQLSLGGTELITGQDRAVTTVPAGRVAVIKNSSPTKGAGSEH